MPRRRGEESRTALNDMDDTLTWRGCYAFSTTDWMFAGDTVTGTPSEEEAELDAAAEEKDPSNALVKPPEATVRSPPHADQRSRSITPPQRRTWTPAASDPSRDSRRHGFPAQVCECCSCCCAFYRRRRRPRRFRPRMHRPRVSPWEHLPVVLRPTRWYQVVGSMQCGLCKSRGRHQMTSWMCHSCKVPLCLLPYRNCYAKWHGEDI